MNVKTLFPKASKSFHDANPHVCGQLLPENDVQAMPNSKKRHSMTKPEREYAMILEARKRAGEILDYRFEAVKLKIGDGCWYCPDFMVFQESMLQHDLGRQIKFIEIKGAHIWDDAKVKFKVAKEQNRWAKWEMWQKTKEAGWKKLI